MPKDVVLIIPFEGAVVGLMKMDQDSHDLAGAEVRRTAALRLSLGEFTGDQAVGIFDPVAAWRPGTAAYQRKQQRS
jgi:hypothetical protein